MDYFTDVLATFLDPKRVRTLAVYGKVQHYLTTNFYVFYKVANSYDLTRMICLMICLDLSEG